MCICIVNFNAAWEIGAWWNLLGHLLSALRKKARSSPAVVGRPGGGSAQQAEAGEPHRASSPTAKVKRKMIRFSSETPSCVSCIWLLPLMNFWTCVSCIIDNITIHFLWFKNNAFSLICTSKCPRQCYEPVRVKEYFLPDWLSILSWK